MSWIPLVPIKVKDRNEECVENSLNTAKEIGCFSVDQSKPKPDDRSLMRYYSPRMPPFNLGKDCKKYTKRVHEPDAKMLDHLLEWIVLTNFKCFKLEDVQNEGQLHDPDPGPSSRTRRTSKRLGDVQNEGQLHDSDPGPSSRIRRTSKRLKVAEGECFSPGTLPDPESLPVDFVTSRGTIKRLLCTPYFTEKSNNWIIYASKLDGVIYFGTSDTDANLKKGTSEEEKEWSTWGFKFEELMTSDRPGGTPSASSTTCRTGRFCIVVENRIEKYNLLFRAEIDAAKRKPEKGQTSAYIELKTTRRVSEFLKENKFRNYKSLEWWTQSKIVGIEETVCGMRDDEGKVHKVRAFKTEEIPDLVLKKWEPKTCFSFCYRFLKELKNIVKKDDHRTVYRFEYYGKDDIPVSCQEGTADDDKYRVISDWYASKLRENKKTS